MENVVEEYIKGEMTSVKLIDFLAEEMGELLSNDIQLATAAKMMALFDAVREIEVEKGLELTASALLQKYALVTVAHESIKRANEKIQRGERLA